MTLCKNFSFFLQISKHIRNNIFILPPIFFNRKHLSVSRLNGTNLCLPQSYFINCYSTMTDKFCWKCGKSSNELFCGHCNSLQKVNSDLNYFELLGVDLKFDIETAQLSNKYRELQSVLHPDKFGNKSEEEKLISAEYSSLINKGYSTLNNPIERGLYLLKLKGESIEENMIQADPTFLMEIIEKNEEVEVERDAHRLSEYKRINKEIMDKLIRDLSTAFKENDIPTAKEVLTKLKYYSSIDLKIKKVKRILGIPD